MQKFVGYHILNGLWNPRDKNYSWVTARDYPAMRPGRQEGGYYLDCFLLGIDPDDEDTKLMSKAKIADKAKEVRKTYRGPPVALAVVTTEVIETLRGDEPEAQADDAELVDA